MTTGAAELLPSGGDALEFLDVGGDVAARSPLQLFWRRLRQDRVALVSLGFIVFLIVIAFAAPLVVSLLGLPGPNVQNLNLTDSFGSPLGPSLAHPFGVDPLGEDVMSRVIYGTRVSLEVGIIGTGISTVIGVTVGMLAGFYRGWVDTVLSRFDRRRAVDPGPAARARPRGRVLGAGLCERTDPAGPRHDHLHHRAGHLAVRRADRAWPRAVDARARVRRGLARVSGRRTCASCSARSCPT